MDVEISEERVDFLKNALYTHVRQVDDYFNSARSRINSYDGGLHERHKSEFAVRAQLLVAQLQQLVLCAGRVRALSRNVNIEQLEAMIDKLNTEILDIAA